MNTLPSPALPRSFHVMTKPIGPLCNLDCRYCFYLEQENLYPKTHQWQIPDAMLENYIQQYIQAQQTPLHTHTRRRAGAELSVRRLQTVLQTY